LVMKVISFAKLITEPKRFPDGNVAIIPAPKAWAAQYAHREGLKALQTGELLHYLRPLPNKDIFGRPRIGRVVRGGEICIIPAEGKALGDTVSEKLDLGADRWNEWHEPTMFGEHACSYFFEVPKPLKEEKGMIFVPSVSKEGKQVYRFEYAGGNWNLQILDDALLEIVKLPQAPSNGDPGLYRTIHQSTGLPLGETTYWGDRNGAIPHFKREKAQIVSPVIEFKFSIVVVDFDKPLWMNYPEIGKY